MSNEYNPFKVYCNDIEAGISYFDITLILKHITPSEAEILGSVTLSPQHAKSLAHLLTQNIAQYEKNFGEIPLLNNMMEPNNSNEKAGMKDA